MLEINYWAVLVAGASSFLLGGLWYSPMLFEPVWNREANRGAPEKAGHPIQVFGVSFVLSVIAAAAFAYFIGPNPPLGEAVLKGFGVGVCFVATSFGINYQFATRSLLLWMIDGGYHVAQFTLFGLVLGLWH